MKKSSSLPLAFLLVATLAATMRPVFAVEDIATSPTDLGTLGGSISYARSVSDDGTVVVGYSYEQNNVDIYAFRWTESGGLADIAIPTATSSYGYGVSADGSVVAGLVNLSGVGYYQAYRWTSSGGAVALGTLGGSYSAAFGISGDGSTIVGESLLSDTPGDATHAFRWTQSDGLLDLGTLGGTEYSSANAVSNDGSVVVGNSQITGNSAAHAYRWTQGSGMVDLGTLGGSNSYANGVSRDGNTVVGSSMIAGDAEEHAYRWTQGSGMTDLGTLGGTVSFSYGVSGNGSIVVGMSQIADSSERAFRWTQSTGMRDLNELLSEAGINMTGITLREARNISANGRYIVGFGEFTCDSGGDSGSGAISATPCTSGANAYLVCYDPENGCFGVTTSSAQTLSAQKLADNARASMVQSASLANQLLGMTEPMERKSFVRAGVMYGSSEHYAVGQAAGKNLTASAGISWGDQDFDNIDQNSTYTVAGMIRYTFNGNSRDQRMTLRPYVELAGWGTPDQVLTLRREYANGAGVTAGRGNSAASAYAGRARAGVILDANENNWFAGFGEVGKQYLSFKSYDERAELSNPFPASVDGGLLSMSVARAGLQWTHREPDISLTGDDFTPVTLTLAGLAAKSFDTRTSVTASLMGTGTITSSSRSDIWGEFASRLSAQVTDRWSVGLDAYGLAGPSPIGISLHGGAFVVFSF